MAWTRGNEKTKIAKSRQHGTHSEKKKDRTIPSKREKKTKESMYGYTCAGSTNRIRNNNKRSLKCSWVFRPLYWSSWKLRPATVNVSPAVLVHSLGCGLQIKGYGHKKGEVSVEGVVNVKILLNRCR